MPSETQTAAGRDHMIKLLKQEGKYVQFMRLTRQGKMARAQEIAERIVDEHRAEFDKVMDNA